MPLPAARSRSASVPCGTSSASTSPDFVEAREGQHVGRAGGGGEGADHFPHLPVLHQHGDVGHPRQVRAAGGVGDAGEVARALREQRVDEVVGRARRREAAEGDRWRRPGCRRRPRRSSGPACSSPWAALPHAKPSCAERPAASARSLSLPQVEVLDVDAVALPLGFQRVLHLAGVEHAAAALGGRRVLQVARELRHLGAELGQGAEGVHLDRQQEAAVVVPAGGLHAEAEAGQDAAEDLADHREAGALVALAGAAERQQRAALAQALRVGGELPFAVHHPAARDRLPARLGQLHLAHRDRRGRHVEEERALQDRRARRSPRDWCRAALPARRRARRLWASDPNRPRPCRSCPPRPPSAGSSPGVRHGPGGTRSPRRGSPCAPCRSPCASRAR